MKTLEELRAIREKMQRQMGMRHENEAAVRVVVGMATCGIAAGARSVMTALLEAVDKQELSNVVVAQSGCIGVCRLEPIVEVFSPGEEKVTYIKMTPERVARMVTEHLAGGRPVAEFTLGSEG